MEIFIFIGLIFLININKSIFSPNTFNELYSFSIVSFFKKLENNKEIFKNNINNTENVNQELEIRSIKPYSERNLVLTASKFFIFIYYFDTKVLLKTQNKILYQLSLTDNFLPEILTIICLSKDHQIFDFTILPSLGDW